MATESPIMMSSHNEPAFSSAARSVFVEDIRLLRNGQTNSCNGKDSIPDRSGSAPPSMEGSYLAINNIISQQNSANSLVSGKSRETIQNFGVDKQSNVGNYVFNASRSHRIPTPPITRENRYPGGAYEGSWRLATNDSIAKRPSHVQVSLSTHKEECEDDRSTDQPSVSRLWSGDLIQEEFPRTPSPTYNQSRSVSSITDEAADNDGEANSFHELSVSITKTTASSAKVDGIRQPFGSDGSAIPVASTSLNYTGVSPPIVLLRKGNSNGENIPSIESGMKNLGISSLLTPSDQGIPDNWHQNYVGNAYHQQSYPHQNNPYQIHGVKSQIGSQVTGSPYVGMDQFFQAVPKLSTEGQPLLQSSGFTPPLYANAGAYMTSPTPYYPSFQSSGLYQQQYSLSGYAPSSGIIPPYLGGFSHALMPVAYDGQTSTNFNARVSAPTGSNIPHGSDVQNLNKLGGQLGYAPHTTFLDPFYLQYYQQPFGSAYGHPGQYDPLIPGGHLGTQNLLPDSKKGNEFVPVSDDHKAQYQRPGVGYINHMRGVITPHYMGCPQNMSLVMQYPPSPLAVPLFSESTGNNSTISEAKDDSRLAGGANKYANVYTGWQGRRVVENYNDPRVHNFLEELKSGKGRRFELSDITGHIVEFSTDQHGSRFIQQKLESCCPEEKAAVFQEVLPYAPKLMTDVFGNYVVQKFFEYGTTDQRRELANQLAGQILPLSLQMYGCRVIQKALDVIDLDQKAQLIRELEGHVLRCVRDQNGNHVIQKCIESVPAESIGFIISAFRGQVATLSMHPYGCRVIQRVLEHCTDEFHFQFIVDEILESVYVLSQDQYGNYVTQHVMERGKPHERVQIVYRLLRYIVPLSQHKFASNVIEKCLEYGGTTERNLIIDEVLGESEENDNLLVMMKDQFANYVVQKVLDTCSDSQRLTLLGRIRPHLHALKKYTYGKHIVGRFEQQFGEGEDA